MRLQYFEVIRPIGQPLPEWLEHIMNLRECQTIAVTNGEETILVPLWRWPLSDYEIEIINHEIAMMLQ